MKSLLSYLGLSALLALLLLGHYFFGYYGHYGYDDVMGYMYQAAQLVQGQFHLGDDHYAYRWGTIFPTALSYALFGINDFAGALPAMLITGTTALLIFWSLGGRWKGAGIWGVLLFFFNEWSLFYSDKVMPDILVALGTLGLFLCLWRLRFKRQGGPSWPYALSFSLILLYSFWAKETIILSLPVFFVFFLLDVYRREYLAFWTWAIGFSILFFALYFGVIYGQTGSFLYRFKAIELGSYFNPCSYDQLPISHLLERISYGLGLLFLRSGLLPVLGMGLGSLFFLKGRLWKLDSESAFWSLSLGLSVFSAYFMTISYKAYVPMCGTDVRHFLYLAPLAAIAATPYLQAFWQRKQYAFGLLLPLWLWTALAYWLGYGNALSIGAWALALSLFALSPQRLMLGARALSISLFILALAYPTYQSMQYAQTQGYIEQRELILRHFSPDQQQAVIVISNPVQRNFGEYYMQFAPQSQVLFWNYQQAAQEQPQPNSRYYLLLNGFSRYQSNTSWEELPPLVQAYYQDQKQLPLKLIDSQKEGAILLLEITDPAAAWPQLLFPQ